MTSTSPNKPTAMEKVKEKAINLVDKVTGKSHPHEEHVNQYDSNVDPITHVQHPTLQPQSRTQHTHGYVPPTNANANPGMNVAATQQHSGPLHTGAALSSAAVPHKPTVEGTAYEQQFHPQGTRGTTHTATSIPSEPVVTTGRAIDPKLAQAPLHHQQQPSVTTTTTTAAPLGMTGQQHHPSAPTVTAGTTKGATGSHIPTYAQNIPPTAAGVVPTAAYTAGIIEPSQQLELGAAGNMSQRDPNHPANANPFPEDHHHHQKDQTLHHRSHPTEGTSLGDKFVPAMGAPDTTTAAGTHIPGQYHSRQ